MKKRDEQIQGGEVGGVGGSASGGNRENPQKDCVVCMDPEGEGLSFSVCLLSDRQTFFLSLSLSLCI